MTQLVSLILIRWKVIYSVDSAIQRLNNQGQISTRESNCVIQWIDFYPVDSAIQRLNNRDLFLSKLCHIGRCVGSYTLYTTYSSLYHLIRL